MFAKQTFVANLLEVQDTKCSFSTAERIGSHSARRRLENGRPTSITIVETFSPQYNNGRDTLHYCSQRHPHSLSDKHMSFDMVDNVPQSVPVSSFPSKWHTCDDNESVLRMIFEGRRLSQRPVPRTHRVTLHWSFGKNQLRHIRFRQVRFQPQTSLLIW